MSGLRIVKPGLLSLIQDQGRFGQMHNGFAAGGPADRLSFYWANRLVGNPVKTSAYAPAPATLEITGGGAEFEVQGAVCLSIAGADMPITINGVQQANWRSFNLTAGERITLGHSQHGMRAYIAVAGGFELTPQYGSCATLVREGLGGTSGKPLAADELLRCPNSQGECLSLPRKHQPQFNDELVLRVVPGYQQQQISRLQQRRFFSSEYELSPQHDRMGYRLKGPAIEVHQHKMLSEGISAGAIQIPGDGQPIVLMADRQTMGGYPKIGNVLSLDLDKLAQASLGCRIRFDPISAHCAHNALHLAQAQRQGVRLLAC